jgi:8-oxo-dGTP diphosphatase
MRWCLGFALSPDRRSVLLLRKDRPAWQAGRWNGIGGKLEPGEDALAAMVREGVEEVGQAFAWRPIARLRGSWGEVHVFAAEGELRPRRRESEEPAVFPVEALFAPDGPPLASSSVRVLVALALDRSGIRLPVDLEVAGPEG